MNHDAQGKPYPQAPTVTKQLPFDPKHEHADVMVQLQNQNGGFITDFVNNYPASSDHDRQEIMDYYPVDFLPGLHSLARDFTVCDRWYSSLPGPTWPNRFFALSGTSNGRILMPAEGFNAPDLGKYFQQTQDTIFDRLNEAGRRWRVYYCDFPSSWLLLRQLLPQNVVNYRPIDLFFDDARDEKSFPEFVFIEPKYFGADENDDHPPHNIMKGEKFIADVYNAIRSNPDLWNSTLLVVSFDEHGGFYDHVTPPGAVAPDDHQERVHLRSARRPRAGHAGLAVGVAAGGAYAVRSHQPAEVSDGEVEPRTTGPPHRGRDQYRCRAARDGAAQRYGPVHSRAVLGADSGSSGMGAGGQQQHAPSGAGSIRAAPAESVAANQRAVPKAVRYGRTAHDRSGRTDSHGRLEVAIRGPQDQRWAGIALTLRRRSPVLPHRRNADW